MLKRYSALLRILADPLIPIGPFIIDFLYPVSWKMKFLWKGLGKILQYSETFSSNERSKVHQQLIDLNITERDK